MMETETKQPLQEGMMTGMNRLLTSLLVKALCNARLFIP